MDDLIEIEDKAGNRVTVTRAHYDRWPSVRANFRPVAEKKTLSGVVKETTPVVVEPPTGDEKKEK